MVLSKNILYNCSFLYGARKNYIDVTDIMKNNILKTNKIMINNNLFKIDPAPNIIKNLIIKNYDKNNITMKEGDIIHMKYDDMPFIDRNNINKITNIINNYDTINIFGKGPTFTNIKKPNKSIFHIAINQAANYLDDVDVLFINDIHNIFKITSDTFKKLKYIITPEYMNIDLQYDENGYWKNAYIYALANGFTGDYLIYNLNLRTNNKNIITLDTYITSSNNAIEFICKFTKVNNINTYGIGKNGLNYGDGFVGNGIYNVDRIKMIYDNIIFFKEKYNRNIIVN